MLNADETLSTFLVKPTSLIINEKINTVMVTDYLFRRMILINDGPASNLVQDDHGCLQSSKHDVVYADQSFKPTKISRFFIQIYTESRRDFEHFSGQADEFLSRGKIRAPSRD